jgi:hypothetical protein
MLCCRVACCNVEGYIEHSSVLQKLLHSGRLSLWNMYQTFLNFSTIIVFFLTHLLQFYGDLITTMDTRDREFFLTHLPMCLLHIVSSIITCVFIMRVGYNMMIILGNTSFITWVYFLCDVIKYVSAGETRMFMCGVGRCVLTVFITVFL